MSPSPHGDRNSTLVILDGLADVSRNLTSVSEGLISTFMEIGAQLRDVNATVLLCLSKAAEEVQRSQATMVAGMVEALTQAAALQGDVLRSLQAAEGDEAPRLGYCGRGTGQTHSRERCAAELAKVAEALQRGLSIGATVAGEVVRNQGPSLTPEEKRLLGACHALLRLNQVLLLLLVCHLLLRKSPELANSASLAVTCLLLLRARSARSSAHSNGFS